MAASARVRAVASSEVNLEPTRAPATRCFWRSIQVNWNCTLVHFQSSAYPAASAFSFCCASSCMSCGSRMVM